MSTELDLADLSAQVEHLNGERPHGWELEQAIGVLKVWVRLTPHGFADVYCLRLDYVESLSAGPPSVTFCDSKTHAEGNPIDWPANLTDYFKHPPSNGLGWICNEWTREGRQHHPEWNLAGWRANRAVWRVASAIQDILDKRGNYRGRHQ